MPFLIKDIVHRYSGKGITDEVRNNITATILKIEDIAGRELTSDPPKSNEEEWAEFRVWQSLHVLAVQALAKDQITLEEHALIFHFDAWLEEEKRAGHFDPEYTLSKPKKSA